VIQDAWRGLLELLAPPTCAACALPIEAREDGFCSGCAVLIDEVPAPPGCEDRAACVYGGPIAEAIARLKYRATSHHAGTLAGLLIEAAESWHGSVDRVCVVPIHRRRLIQRGYNQSALLAWPVARALGARFDPSLLSRERETGTQVGSDPGTRKRQLQGSFRAARRAHASRVLVIDDVRTTGATLQEARRALTEVGAQRVYTLTLAVASQADQS
jgi:ComF family protein